MSVCQIPGCPRSATRPARVEHLCVPCRFRVRSRCRFSPLLFWGMLWVMAKDLHELLMEKSLEAGEIEVDHRRYTSAEGLLQRLLQGQGLSQFLSWVAAEIGTGHIPQTELRWLDRFATKFQFKSQRRILTTYWRMLCPSLISRDAWIILTVEERVFVATANTGLRDVERVLRALKTRTHKTQTTWILEIPWPALFPPRRHLEDAMSQTAG